jgi:L-serine dehydratase
MHGFCFGDLGGLAGWDATDERLAESADAIQEAGIRIQIEIKEIGAKHPNTYKLALSNSSEQHTLTALSTGGGMIEIVEIDGADVSLAGDYYETLVFVDPEDSQVVEYLRRNIEADEINLSRGKDVNIIEIKAQDFLGEGTISALRSQFHIRELKPISPVLPVLSRQSISVPFITCEQMLQYAAGQNLALWELAVRYESARGNIPREQVWQRMEAIVHIMQRSIHDGIAGTKYADRILGPQSGLFQSKMANRQLLDGGMLNQMILHVTAMMEVKSSMGVIVAAPTAGSCGGLPGACLGAASALGSSVPELTQAMLAAGMIGVFVAAHATFAAEIGGCQAECGSGSGMAAAALVTLARGTLKQAVDASSMALQNILGMVCDPVAGRVEVPCLGKNVLAASNALACANMALADYDVVIPLDEAIEAMDRVGKSLPHELRCTALGGLSITKTSKEIEKMLIKP